MSDYTHFTDYYNDFFAYSPSNTDNFVIDDIKPAYSLFIESLDIESITMKTYLSGSSFKKNYDIAKKDIETYIKDVTNKSTMVRFSKMPIAVIIAIYKKNKYVVKGEFVLRVINDFILGKIDLAGYSFKKFMSFVSDTNADLWGESIISMNKTIIQLDSSKTLKAYLHLLDRYEIYDEKFIENVRMIVDVFLF